MYQRLDLRPLLGRIRAPTLVVAGELDLICGPAQARPNSQAVPNVKVVLIPDCGHLPMAEVPERFREKVMAWLKSSRRV